MEHVVIVEALRVPRLKLRAVAATARHDHVPNICTTGVGNIHAPHSRTISALHSIEMLVRCLLISAPVRPARCCNGGILPERERLRAPESHTEMYPCLSLRLFELRFRGEGVSVGQRFRTMTYGETIRAPGEDGIAPAVPPLVS